MGQVFTPSIQVGYMFNKYIGLELGIAYLLGSKFNIPSNGNSDSYDSVNTIK